MKSNFLKLVFLAGTTNQTCEIGDNNDSGPSARRNILSKRQSSRVKKRTMNYADDDAKVIQKIQGLNMTKWLF